MKVKLKVYDGVKYWDGTQKVAEVNYDIQGYEVKQIPDEEIAAMGFDTVDEFEEYLILTLKSRRNIYILQFPCRFIQIIGGMSHVYTSKNERKCRTDNREN